MDDSPRDEVYLRELMTTQERKERAKSVSIDSLMSSMGYKPVKETSGRSWYLSPFRGENNPSFVVNKKENSYIDWGDQNKHGDAIALVMQINNVSFHEAIDTILNDGGLRRHNPKEIPDEPRGIHILDVRDITNRAHIDYARSRAISPDLLKKYCKDVEFSFAKWPNISYRAIGFLNNKGGWELRSEKHKVCSAPKTWTTIEPGSPSAYAQVFEGFFDFLSHLQYNRRYVPDHTSYILNGLVYIPFIVDETKDFEKVLLYLDNGAAADRYIGEYLTDKRFVKNNRELYPFYEDYNDFIKDKLLNKKQ